MAASFDQCNKDDSPADEVEAAWDAEIRRRVEEIEFGRAKLVPWEQVLKGINERFGWTSK
jgi:putative addiction module component (TIGR02574 family)